MSATAFAAPLDWTLSEVSGPVRILNGKTLVSAKRGAALPPGTSISTGARARIVMVRGAEFVVVSPGARLRIPRKQSGIVQMLQDFGTAMFRIDKKSTPHFSVQTPFLAAAVKGTVFTVAVDRAGASVGVREGAVDVSTLDRLAHNLVRPGMKASVAAANPSRLSFARVAIDPVGLIPPDKPAVPRTLADRAAALWNSGEGAALFVVLLSLLAAASLAINARRARRVRPYANS